MVVVAGMVMAAGMVVVVADIVMVAGMVVVVADIVMVAGTVVVVVVVLPYTMVSMESVVGYHLECTQHGGNC